MEFFLIYISSSHNKQGSYVQVWTDHFFSLAFFSRLHESWAPLEVFCYGYRSWGTGGAEVYFRGWEIHRDYLSSATDKIYKQLLTIFP